MQHLFSKNEQEILNAIAQVIKRERKSTTKSQRLLADEYGLYSSMFSRLERAQNQPKLFSIWFIAEALGMKTSEFLALVEKELPEGFTLND